MEKHYGSRAAQYINGNRDVLSFYAQDGGASVHKNDVKTGSPGKQKTFDVPIFEESNFCNKMAIDEKHIGENFYTITSNRDTGKIAMLCNSYNFTGLEQVLVGHPSILPKVKSITRDFSALFKKLCNRLFPGAVQVRDKFNIIRHFMEANLAIRINIRQKELQKRREAFNEFKGVEKLRLEECEWTGKEFKLRKFHYKEIRLENGETRWNGWPRASATFLSSPINGSPNRRQGPMACLICTLKLNRYMT